MMESDEALDRVQYRKMTLDGRYMCTCTQERVGPRKVSFRGVFCHSLIAHVCCGREMLFEHNG